MNPPARLAALLTMVFVGACSHPAGDAAERNAVAGRGRRERLMAALTQRVDSRLRLRAIHELDAMQQFDTESVVTLLGCLYGDPLVGSGNWDAAVALSHAGESAVPHVVRAFEEACAMRDWNRAWHILMCLGRMKHVARGGHSGPQGGTWEWIDSACYADADPPSARQHWPPCPRGVGHPPRRDLGVRSPQPAWARSGERAALRCRIP